MSIQFSVSVYMLSHLPSSLLRYSLSRSDASLLKRLLLGDAVASIPQLPRRAVFSATKRLITEPKLLSPVLLPSHFIIVHRIPFPEVGLVAFVPKSSRDETIISSRSGVLATSWGSGFTILLTERC